MNGTESLLLSKKSIFLQIHTISIKDHAAKLILAPVICCAKKSLFCKDKGQRRLRRSISDTIASSIDQRAIQRASVFRQSVPQKYARRVCTARLLLLSQNNINELQEFCSRRRAKQLVN
jgi:hypothetical protein